MLVGEVETSLAAFEPAGLEDDLSFLTDKRPAFVGCLDDEHALDRRASNRRIRRDVSEDRNSKELGSGLSVCIERFV